MSSALAIASVTRLLKDMLSAALSEADASGQIGSDVAVTALPPDQVAAMGGENQATRLNLFLHRITPNTALGNSDLPTRNCRGQLTTRPRLALDLHYLLTAYGSQELRAEILLGHAMLAMHEMALLPRELVRFTLGPPGPDGVPAFGERDPAGLADQLELIKITPQNLSLDDMSKLWTSLQSTYRTTVAYGVSVVLMERQQPVVAALPVLSRGPVENGRDAGITVATGLLPATPTITRVVPPGDRPAMRLGDTIAFTGFHLDAGDARARFIDVATGDAIELAPATPPTGDRLLVRLPDGAPLPQGSPLTGTGADPARWRVGSYATEIVIGSPRRSVTNRLTVALAPRAAPVQAPAGAGVRITVGCAPAIRAGQSVTIIAGEQERVLDDPDAPTESVAAEFAGLPSGIGIPVRLRVSGIDSLLIDPSQQPPRFDPTQLVQLP